MQSREIEDVETYCFILFSFFLSFLNTNIERKLSIRTHREIDPTLEAQKC
jgi:hypothetical protein